MDKDEFKKSLKNKGDYGLFPPPTNAQEGLRILMKHFLGNDWYVVDPLCNEQVNTVAIYEILERYPSGKFRRVCKNK